MKTLQIQQRSSVDEVSAELGSKLTAANQNITELEHKLQVRGLLYILDASWDFVLVATCAS